MKKKINNKEEPHKNLKQNLISETSKNDGLLLSDISFYMSSVRKIDGMTGIDWS